MTLGIDELKKLREGYVTGAKLVGGSTIVAIIDTALAVIAERDALEGAIQTHLGTAREVGLRIERREGRDGWAVTNDRALKAEAALATARAVAMADAVARLRAWVADYEAINDDRGASVMEAAIAAIRALAPLEADRDFHEALEALEQRK